MERMGIPGAVVTVVRGDRILMNQGFGWSDVANKKAVTAQSTVFRVASVAKVFTALAATRLAAEGRLNIDGDVTEWVPELKLNGRPDAPITVSQLLTHTSGIDERLTGYLNPPGGQPRPLAEALRNHMPERMRLPDTTPAYSNHGYAVVGLVVERITRTPFDAFVRDSILRPLGMTRTAFILRPPADSQALEYTSEGDLRVQRSSVPYPAGNIGATGEDMAVFLRALLTASRDSVAGDSVEGQALRQLFTPTVVYHPEMPPMGYGFAAVSLGGHEVWMKGGAGPSHSAVIALVPSLDLGVFIAVNRQEPTLWDRLLPHIVASYPSGAQRTPKVVRRVEADLSGDYLWSRAPLGSFEKILGLATQIQVRHSGDTVIIAGPFIDGTYLRDGALLFRRADDRPIAFRVDSSGRATRAFSVMVGQPISFEAIDLHRTPRFQLGVLTGATVLALTAGIMTLKRRPEDELQPPWARAAVVALPVAQLVTVGSAILLSVQSDRLWEGPMASLYSTMALTSLTAAVGIAQSAGSAVLARRARTVPGRATYAVAATAGVAMSWFLAANNLIGFRL
jgi:CubicO group peptidase (beta-lactamase class C family)